MTAFLAVFLPLLVAYGATLAWCVDRWNAPTHYFEHCWLVPLVGAFVVWQRRARWTTAAAVPDRRALWMVAPALFLHLCGAQLMIDSWSAMSLVLAVPGAAWLALGTARLRGLWPVSWLVLFAVPLPMYVEGRLAFTLKEVAVDGGAWLANLLGADIVRAGDLLRPSGGAAALYVADACGGLRSLLAMATLSYCLAFFVGAPSWPRRALLLLAAGPVAIAANVVRIALLCLFARWFGVPFAEGTGHTIANVAEWCADVAVLVGVDVVLASRLARPTRQPAPIPAPPLQRPGLAGVGVGLWLCAVPLLWLSLHRPFGVGRGRAENLPEVVAGYALVPRTAAEEARFAASLPRWRELLGTEDFVWRRYRDENGARINLVALFHDTNWKSVHPPRICIEGSTMDIERDDLLPLAGAGPGVAASRIVALGRADGRRYVTLSLFGTRDWASGSYSEFTWYHLPRALLRRNESGFLLRVESPVGRGEAEAAAEARCVRFLLGLLPEARGLVP